eukprot:1919872-Prymnesium_polylepis.1
MQSLQSPPLSASSRTGESKGRSRCGRCGRRLPRSMLHCSRSRLSSRRAPRATSRSATRIQLPSGASSTATVSGVAPLALATSSGTPPAISRSQASQSPARANACSGVSPSQPSTCTSGTGAGSTARLRASCMMPICGASSKRSAIACSSSRSVELSGSDGVLFSRAARRAACSSRNSAAMRNSSASSASSTPSSSLLHASPVVMAASRSAGSMGLPRLMYLWSSNS